MARERESKNRWGRQRMLMPIPVDILIVDDRIDGLITLEAVLKGPGLNIVQAQSGAEALSLLHFHDFAVILLDVQMPVFDGFQTAAKIREHPNHRHTPLIFVTAINKDDRYIDRGYNAGAVDYIFKPFDPHILRSKVNFFIESYRISRRIQTQNELMRESERRERHLKLAELEVESLRRYRDLASAIPHIVWKAKSDGTLDYFNRVWTDYTGLSHELSLGVGWHSALHSDDLSKFLKVWLHAINKQSSFEVECRIRRFDNELRWHWIKAVPETNPLDEIVGWIGTCTDIHDRKQTEQRLKDAERQANSANEAKTHFLANMSHEIRTPLSAILGFTELMMEANQKEEDRLAGILTIRRSSQQLLQLIGEILDISKIESGHLEVETITMNLPGLLIDLQSLLNPQALAKGLRLDLELRTSIPDLIQCDPTRLRQILMNLIGNAIKFSSHGAVTVEVNWQNNNLVFRIIDKGVGIETHHMDRLFQPFTQVDSSTSRRFGGTGLGLALSRRLAQALKGDVILEKSEPNEGSIFRLEVEAHRSSASKMVKALDKSAHETLQSKESVDLSSWKMLLKDVSVLLVDDAVDNQLIFSQFLTSAGATVEIAKNGQEGIQKALDGHYQVVLMDIQMPDLDGYEATSRLRKQGYDRPIIALTAHALKEERDRSISVGCTDHLTKPIDRHLLIQEVARFAHGQQ